ncbi:MAG TPA: DUF962 domain-containing protein [Jatrophihabitans sp.]|uniref:Mpo1-like protein n=1 Tax=Jatrophihabitans sp. TaxID=1932789 RepID=UPI002F1BF85C
MRRLLKMFGSYQEFFPYYVAMHSKPLTRRLHFAGTVSGLALSVLGLLTGRRRLLAALPVLGYGVAWPSHWLVQGNNPASFGHPLWSLRGDFQMIAMMSRGRDRELTLIARDWLAEHPEHRTASNWTEPVVRLVA